jgi:hypothetical protein
MTRQRRLPALTREWYRLASTEMHPPHPPTLTRPWLQPAVALRPSRSGGRVPEVALARSHGDAPAPPQAESRWASASGTSRRASATTVKRKPSSANRQAQTVKREPSNANRQTRTVKRKPSNANRQTQTVNRNAPDDPPPTGGGPLRRQYRPRLSPSAGRQHLELDPAVERIGKVVRAGADHVVPRTNPGRDHMPAQSRHRRLEPLLHIFGTQL